MKYRHAFHAGNFADVHKHVTLLALLAALKRKDKGFLYLDTHAGRGSYDLSGTAESAAGVGRLLGCEHRAAELAGYAAALGRWRAAVGARHLYPGSPLLAALELRAQDRGLFVEWQGPEAHALGAALAVLPGGPGAAKLRVERGDGLAVLRAALPPRERRALVLIDPPYEDASREFTAVAAAVADALRRFATGVFAVWYPIKEQRVAQAWQAEWTRAVAAPTLASELWLYPRDSRVALNGSGLLIVNPPWQIGERMRVWLPQLAACLAVGDSGGSEVRMLSQSPE
ncbi:MAG: 23S rRNA (adenine(2030)-N(6))-methyltransferase RlmJ [Gammaproteobacteria bacterium]|nr:23S rRNA (adenine(2030)-N(6))-methyltransferase RlmJ [Gammaproteobacteria bacterium]